MRMRPIGWRFLESESNDKTVQGPLFRLKIEKVIFYVTK